MYISILWHKVAKSLMIFFYQRMLSSLIDSNIALNQIKFVENSAKMLTTLGLYPRVVSVWCVKLDLGCIVR